MEQGPARALPDQSYGGDGSLHAAADSDKCSSLARARLSGNYRFHELRSAEQRDSAQKQALFLFCNSVENKLNRQRREQQPHDARGELHGDGGEESRSMNSSQL